MHLFADGLQSQQHPKNSDDFFLQICSSLEALFAKVNGAYSVVSAIVDRGLIAFRDPHGIRPLVCGRRKNTQNQYDYIFASEDTMFYTLGFEYFKDVQPGEVMYVDEHRELHQKQIFNKDFHPCIFEHIYLARPDAILDKVSVYRARLRMGQNLASRWQKEYSTIKPDIVIPIPSTSTTAALSFAHQLGVRYSEGIYKNSYIGRTFIMPDQKTRERSVRRKLVPQRSEIKNKKVLILDDSIVRGTTSLEIVKMVREYGAKQVFFVTTCPPVKFPCFYGIDVPNKKELIAANYDFDKIKEMLNVDILLYQAEADLTEAITRKGNAHMNRACMACLNGCYPTQEASYD